MTPNWKAFKKCFGRSYELGDWGDGQPFLVIDSRKESPEEKRIVAKAKSKGVKVAVVREEFTTIYAK